MTPQDVETLLTGPEGFRFARWTKPLAPVVFGTDDATLDIVKPAIIEAASLADLSVTEVDPELGANFMVFFLRDWSELAEATDLANLIPGLPDLTTRLQTANATRYRRLIPAADGTLSLAITFLRPELIDLPARDLTLDLTVRSLLLWSDRAFQTEQTLATIAPGQILIAPRLAALIRAAYDPMLPATSDDPSLAYRLAARAGMLLGDLNPPD